MATADLYSVTLDDGRIISIYFQGVYADSLERFTEELGPIRTRQLRESHQEVPKDNTRILYLAGARGIRLGNGKTITDSQKERWLNKNTGFDIRDIYAEHNVEDKTENP